MRRLLLVLALAGCVDAPAYDATQRDLDVPLDVHIPQVLGTEARFMALGDEVPEFAGYYYVGDELVLRVTNMAARDRVRDAIQAHPVARKRPQSRSGGPPSLRVQLANHTFAELHAWRTALVRLGLVGLDEFAMLDIDEAQNRIVIGVTSEGYTPFGRGHG